jgi:hypothetical protein
MLGPRVLLSTALAAAVVSAGYLPGISSNTAFQYNARRQATNSTSLSFNGPYSTRGRDIVDSNGEKTTWAGVNWPMSGTLQASTEQWVNID